MYDPYRTPGYSQYGWYPAPGYYRDPRQEEEKRALRKLSSGLCWMLVAAELALSLMSVLPQQFLAWMGIGYDPEWSAFNGLPPILYYLAHGCTYLLGFSVPVFLYLAIKNIHPARVLPFERTQFTKALALVVFGVGICTLANIPAQWIMMLEQAMGYSGEIPDLPISNDPWVKVLYFMALAIIPPLTEELIFRGAILGSLRKYGDGFAVLASAFLFAIYHGNFPQAVFAFPCGVVMGFALVKTNCLWAPIAIHFINNGIATVATLAEYQGGGALFYTISFFATIVLGLLAVIFLTLRDREIFVLSRGNCCLRFGQKFGALVGNPGAILLILICIVTAVSVLLYY